jgi:hypothetical protein
MTENMYITDRGLVGLRFLTTLNINGSTHITNSGIRELTKLITLSLGRTSTISNDGLKVLTDLTSLNLALNTKFQMIVLKDWGNLFISILFSTN